MDIITTILFIIIIILIVVYLIKNKEYFNPTIQKKIHLIFYDEYNKNKIYIVDPSSNDHFSKLPVFNNTLKSYRRIPCNIKPINYMKNGINYKINFVCYQHI